MITVRDLKKFGVEAVAGDVMRAGYKVTEVQVECMNNTTHYDDYLIYEFAWRENTGEKPDFDGAIKVVRRNSSESHGYIASLLGWDLQGYGSDIVGWKPCMKSLLAQVESGDPEQAEEVQLGIKHDQDKPRYDLLPAVAIDELAKVLTFGAKKYAPNSWQAVENGLERYRAALLRHTFAIQRGELIDEESGLQHSAHAMTCAAFIVELEKQLEQE